MSCIILVPNLRKFQKFHGPPTLNPIKNEWVSCGSGLVSGSAVVQVSRGDLGPALWELVRAQEIDHTHRVA